MSAEKGSSNGADVDDRSSIAEHRLVSRRSVGGRGMEGCERAILNRCDSCTRGTLRGTSPRTGVVKLLDGRLWGRRNTVGRAVDGRLDNCLDEHDSETCSK